MPRPPPVTIVAIALPIPDPPTRDPDAPGDGNPGPFKPACNRHVNKSGGRPKPPPQCPGSSRSRLFRLVFQGVGAVDQVRSRRFVLPDPMPSPLLGNTLMTGSSEIDGNPCDRLPLPLAQLHRRDSGAKAGLEPHLAAYLLWEAALRASNTTPCRFVSWEGEAPAEPPAGSAGASTSHVFVPPGVMLDTLKLLGSVAVAAYAGRVAPPTRSCPPGSRHSPDPPWATGGISPGAGQGPGRRPRPRLRDPPGADPAGRPRQDLPRAAALGDGPERGAGREPGDEQLGPGRRTCSNGSSPTATARSATVRRGSGGKAITTEWEASSSPGAAEVFGGVDLLAGRGLTFVSDVRRQESGCGGSAD